MHASYARSGLRALRVSTVACVANPANPLPPFRHAGKKLLTSIVLTVEPDKPDSQNRPGQLRLSEVLEENSTGQEATGPSTNNFFRENTQGHDVPTLGASKISSHKSPRHLDKSSSGESSKGASGFLSGLFSPRGSAEAAAPAAAPSSARSPGSARSPTKSPRGSAEKAAASAATGLQKVAL